MAKQKIVPAPKPEKPADRAEWRAAYGLNQEPRGYFDLDDPDDEEAVEEMAEELPIAQREPITPDELAAVLRQMGVIPPA